MKKAGIIFSIDLLRTLYTGINNIKHENILEMKKLEDAKEKRHVVRWKPTVGFGMMVIGAAFLILGRKKHQSKEKNNIEVNEWKKDK